MIFQGRWASLTDSEQYTYHMGTLCCSPLCVDTEKHLKTGFSTSITLRIKIFRFFARKSDEQFWNFLLKNRKLIKVFTFDVIFRIYWCRRTILTTKRADTLILFRSYSNAKWKLRNSPLAKHYFTRDIIIYINQFLSSRSLFFHENAIVWNFD